jgi:nucleoside phosphorylase
VIAITFALMVESSGFVSRLADKKRVACGDTQIIEGKLGNRSVAVFHTGVGEKVCRRRILQFLQDRQFNFLISAGFAGALTDEFRVGDLLLAQNFSTANLDRMRVIFSHLNVRTGDLLTVSRILDSPEERTRAAKKSGAVAIDMETECIARACAEHALPLLALRVISDTPARPLPAPPEVLFDLAHQKMRPRRLAAHLITRPPALLRLMRFARQIRKARKILTNAIVDVATAL